MKMKQEFITAIEAAAEKLKQDLLQDAHTDWATNYNRMDLNPTQAKDLAAKYVHNFMLQSLYLQSSKNLNNGY